MKRKSLMLLSFLFLPVLGWSMEYYVDAQNGHDNNMGTSGNPWRTWRKIQSAVSAGDIVNMTGNFRDIEVLQEDPVGSFGNWIVYQAWTGMPPPRFSSIMFDGTDKDAYLKFIGIYVDPGYVEEQRGEIVGLRGADYVVLEGSYFEGEKIAGSAFEQGSFTPYVHFGSRIITAGRSPGMASHITVKSCTIKNAYRGLYVVEHPDHPERKVESWEIIDNDFAECGEDGITTSGGCGHVIADNYFHDHNIHKVPVYWAGIQSGDWSGKKGQTVTQDGTNASGIFYEIKENFQAAGISGDVIFIYADDANHIPSRINTETWRLDSDPGISFTPLGAGDSAHGDFIAVQGSSHDMIIERNIFNQGQYGAQTIKIEPATRNITFRNNLIYSVYTRAYQIQLAGFNIRLYNNTIDLINGEKTRSCLRLFTKSAQGGAINDTEVYFYNNIISGATYTGGTIYSDHNIWKTGPPEEFNEGPNSLVENDYDTMLFTNREQREYQLPENSPAINFGTPDYHPDNDITGKRRDSLPDAGCYEYGSVSESDHDQDQNLEYEADAIPETNELVVYNNIIKKNAHSNAMVACHMHRPGRLTITIFGGDGRKISVLVDEEKDAGIHRIEWDGKDRSGSRVGSGIYYINMETESYSKTGKIAIVK
ncbi:MAG: hypothetical protein GF384_01040 [Elusimicrobia bacterium]|nr:hypothetical protein [Elusimicrobiota bacterium]